MNLVCLHKLSWAVMLCVTAPALMGAEGGCGNAAPAQGDAAGMSQAGVAAVGGEAPAAGGAGAAAAGQGGAGQPASAGQASAGSGPGGSGSPASSGSAAGGTTASPPAASCQRDADCQLQADYCTGCDCVALAPTEKPRACSGPGVSCFADPCLAKAAACVSGKCVVR